MHLASTLILICTMTLSGCDNKQTTDQTEDGSVNQGVLDFDFTPIRQCNWRQNEIAIEIANE